MNSMPNTQVEILAQQLVDGAISLDRFLTELAQPKTADLGETSLDLDRRRRCGYPEVVYGEGKTVAQIEKIFERMLAEKIEIFATRISPDVAASLAARFPTARYNAVARTLRIEQARNTNVSPTNGSQRKARAAIVTAGTSDIPVAEEARE